jgi:hypothetical protein
MVRYVSRLYHYTNVQLRSVTIIYIESCFSAHLTEDDAAKDLPHTSSLSSPVPDTNYLT